MPLQQLQQEAQRDLPAICRRYGIGEEGSNTVENLQYHVEKLIAHVYTTAIQNAREALPRVDTTEGFDRWVLGWNSYREQAHENLAALLPNTN